MILSTDKTIQNRFSSCDSFNSIRGDGTNRIAETINDCGQRSEDLIFKVLHCHDQAKRCWLNHPGRWSPHQRPLRFPTTAPPGDYSPPHQRRPLTADCIEKKEHFSFDGFSQYVDSLLSKRKEYTDYSKLPGTIKKQICNSLFSTAIMEVEAYIKEKLLEYLNAILQLDLDYWCV